VSVGIKFKKNLCGISIRVRSSSRWLGKAVVSLSAPNGRELLVDGNDVRS